MRIVLILLALALANCGLEAPPEPPEPREEVDEQAGPGVTISGDGHMGAVFR